MTWWLWVLFWVVFWTCAAAYVIWCAWKLWPHMRAFGQTVSAAWERVETTRQTAREMSTAPERSPRGELTPAQDVDSLAWNKSAAQWRGHWRDMRRRQRELALDEHAKTWATWGRRVD